MKIIKLKFEHSPLHIGEIGLGLEECSPIIHSDTMFNALINSYSLMHNKEETNEFVKKFENVKISSAYPFLNDEIFFPRPRVKIKIIEGEDIEYKKLKETEYISKKYFEKIINNEEFSREDIEEITEKKEIYKEYQIPKVYLDRETKNSDFFFISLIRFKENAGLWFTIDCENSIFKEITSCLRLLSDEGIGGKRTWGHGLFEFKEENIELRVPNGNLYMLLSLFYPNENERILFNSNKSSWEFIQRGGYAGGNERKPRIRMIREGSVFDKKPEGSILNFNNYSIYGKAFTVKIKGDD